MRITLTCAALALALGSGPAFAQSGEITIWSWNIAASSLKATVAGFNKQFPDIKVTVEDLGNQQIYRQDARRLRRRRRRPARHRHRSRTARPRIFWSQFPDCFVDLKTLGYTAEIQAKFPDFKRTELEVGDKAYAMPWDSGPVAAFYRRDFYEKAGVDPASIKTWDDFIAAGKKIQAANPGVTMTNADFNGDSEFFRMIANEQGCGYFADRRPGDHRQPAGMRRRADQGQGDEGRRHRLVGRLGREDPRPTPPAPSPPRCMAAGMRAPSASTSPERQRQMGRLPDAEPDRRRPARRQSRRLVARHHLGLARTRKPPTPI